MVPRAGTGASHGGGLGAHDGVATGVGTVFWPGRAGNAGKCGIAFKVSLAGSENGDCETADESWNVDEIGETAGAAPGIVSGAAI